MTINVGFIGPGIMGRPMALNLIKGGCKLWAYARRPETLQPLTAAGAIACATPAEVAEHSARVVILDERNRVLETIEHKTVQ